MSRAGAGATSSTAGRSGSGAAGSTSAVVPPATFTQVYSLFMQRCAGGTCHVGGNGAATKLLMGDKATAYKNLVGVAAASCRGEKRVVAGNPDKSELVHTLARTKLPSCSGTPEMPLALPKLEQNEIDTVIGWVKAGAPNN